MRYYTIDDLRPEDCARLQERLREMVLQSDLVGLYWLPVPGALLSPVQQDHMASCGPHGMALDVTDTSLQLELLVRARGKMRCECVHYASPALQAHMLQWLDELLHDLNIVC